jgi:hypothetical protein
MLILKMNTFVSLRQTGALGSPNLEAALYLRNMLDDKLKDYTAYFQSEAIHRYLYTKRPLNTLCSFHAWPSFCHSHSSSKTFIQSEMALLQFVIMPGLGNFLRQADEL